MTDHAWIKEFPGAVTVCDADGVVLEMNDQSAENLAADGGYALVGQNLLGCHPADARRKLEHLLNTHQANIYTIEKHGVRQLIYQVPWYVNGEFKGLVELELVIPWDMPHFVRQ